MLTEPPPTKVEGFSGLERLRRTVGSFPTEVGGFKPDFWKMNTAATTPRSVILLPPGARFKHGCATAIPGLTMPAMMAISPR